MKTSYQIHGKQPIIKRTSISREVNDFSFDELCVMIQRLYKITTLEMVLKYEDDDRDLICLETDNDLAHALNLSSTLKIYISNQKDCESIKPTIQIDESKELLASLVHIQNTMEKLVLLMQGFDILTRQTR